MHLLTCFHSRHHPIRLNHEFQLDLKWWKKFLNSWHGVSFWLFPGLIPCPDFELFSDDQSGLEPFVVENGLMVHGWRAKMTYQ